MSLHASIKNHWEMPVQRDRLDWSEVRNQVNLVEVVIALLGYAPGRRGEGSGRRLWWNCPFHEDANPSFCVIPGRRTWKCWGCAVRGDTATLVMRLQRLSFPEAVRWLADQTWVGIRPASGGKPIPLRPRVASKPAEAPTRPPEQPSGLSLADASKLVEDAAVRLWTPEGERRLEYLRGRGLSDETTKAARLGWTPGVSIPIREGTGLWTVEGIVIPWRDGDRLTLVKLRQPKGRKPKYAEVYRDRPMLYSADDRIRPGRPLIIVEGELDALLLGQALGELAAVVTLGSASARPEAALLGRMLAAPVWYVATDADDAGDHFASWWPSRAIRVRPPAGKDWTEAHQAGINLRRWWTDRLGGIERPPLRGWGELAALRWGPAIGDPTLGIIIGDRHCSLIATDTGDFDPYAIEERLAIQMEHS